MAHHTLIVFSILNCLFCLLWSATVRAEDAETKIQVSIYDLVGHRKQVNSSRLDAGYVRSVLAVLKSEEMQLKSCLKAGESLKEKFLLTVASNGKGAISKLSKNPAHTSAETCIEGVLEKIKYPRHQYSKAVEFELPLEISIIN